MRRAALTTLALVACMAGAQAQDMPDMDMGAMPGMHHHGTPTASAPADGGDDPHAPDRRAKNTPEVDHQQMHAPAATSAHRPGTATVHSSSDSMHHEMGPVQRSTPTPDARDPDYSDGLRASAMHGIGMAMGDPRFATLHIDRLEAFQASHAAGQQWEAEGGYGSSRDRLWLRTEGERNDGRLETADVELLWGHAVSPFWDTQLGVRTDTGQGPGRSWVAFGIQGLAPYWFELQATGYVGPAGRTAARLRADYELMFTQRLVLQPELELNAYGKADPGRGLGSGLSDATLGLRLRYEIQREIAPYVGGVWTRRFGGTAGQGNLFAWQWVAGVRIRL